MEPGFGRKKVTTVIFFATKSMKKTSHRGTEEGRNKRVSVFEVAFAPHRDETNSRNHNNINHYKTE